MRQNWIFVAYFPFQHLMNANKVLVLMENELEKTLYESIEQYHFLHPIYCRL